MAVKKTAKKTTKTQTKGRSFAGFSDEERAAARDRVKELKAEAGGGNAEKDVLARIADMVPADRAMAKRIHQIVKAAAPDLSPKLWYGMPAYAKDGKVVCFFQDANRFKARYATLGFSDKADLDEGAMWPTSYALTELTSADEAPIAPLVKKAAS